MDNNLLVATAILLPAFSAAVCYIVRKAAIRNVIVVLSTLVMFFVAGSFAVKIAASGSIIIDNGSIPDFKLVIEILDLLLLLYIGYTGIRLKKPLIIILTLLQIVPLVLFELLTDITEPKSAFVIDRLSLVMILLISIIGPLITVFAMGYMKEHEHHQHLKVSRQPRFFMILFVFLGAMNALVMANNIMWLYFFWEVTTLCSFLLISHDGNEQSVKNAVRALWINLLGGVAFIAAIIMLYYIDPSRELSLRAVIQNPVKGFGDPMAVVVGLLCFAGLTKSAQFPFQSWLLGAMVAPTPVSALLHSSTMVKAGVYLIVSLSPAFGTHILGKVVAVIGGFTFLAGSAIAISQSNGKRVLAYSTIANLGLIICCAGIGSKVALGAAILLMIFHAVSKGLLFLCVGTVEQGIGSRDIEDMQGLMKKMPYTAVIMVVGMISMLLPPFGVLITKWLAIEAAVSQPLVLIMIVMGSAFTVVFWAKWIGIVLTMSYKPKYSLEKIAFSVRSSLAVMLIGVLFTGIFIEPMYNFLVSPYLNSFKQEGGLGLNGTGGGLWLTGIKGAVTSMGGFSSLYVFLIIFVIILIIPVFLRRTRPETVKPPYLCGENINSDIRGIEFTSPADKAEGVVVRNYYFEGFFGENNLTLWANLAAGAIILIMFGVVI